MIMGIDHVQITVPRHCESEAKNFYCEVLGLNEIEKPDNRKKNGGFWVQLGTTQLHVGLEDEVDRSKTKAHTAYLVKDLEMWRKRLKKFEFEIFESAPFPDAVAFEFRDPFGNRIEIIQKL
jgi:catechol 2,3-dioxygenase-like lactoylglutathione lyase family enzyme